MLTPTIADHALTLDSYYDLIETNTEYLIRYNTYRKALVNEGYDIQSNYNNHHIVTRKKGS